MANRTPQGSVTAEARQKYSATGDGRFPIFDKESALSAIKLRGHAKSRAERLKIIRKAARYAPQAARQALEQEQKSK
jgi:hypothetical protein